MKLLPAFQFRSLSTRLLVLYAGLFAFVLLAVSALFSISVDQIARVQVERQLVASGAVYDRLWQQRTRQMQDAAQLLARDFGFREASATGDSATTASALANLKDRLHADLAVVISADGQVSGVEQEPLRRDVARLWEALDSGQLSGVASIAGRARQIAAAPIMSPTLTGWIVFASDIDARELRGLERLSAIPLHASVIVTAGSGRWRQAANGSTLAQDISQSVGDSLGKRQAFTASINGTPSIGFARSLPAMVRGDHAALLLSYARAEALAVYRPVQWAMTLIALLGLFVVIIASWRTARHITEPLARLDGAAARLAEGDYREVAVEGRDELARLAGGFNRMAHEIEERERRITHLAFNDVLTGLANRSMFHRHVDLLLERSVSNDGLALFCLDLDHFKSINDTMGHSVGDQLLVAVASRLREAARECFVARLGGDEFVVVQPLTQGRHSIDRLAQALVEAVSHPLELEGQQIIPSTSIGISIAPEDGIDAATLLRNADLALYRAKADGRGAYSFFEESLNLRAQERRQVESDLRLAIERGEFELHFQPLFDLEKGRIGSFEALIRWNHPTRGLVSPLDFIPIAEETGLIVPIGAWVMREACRHAMEWPEHVRIAVNVSSIQFHRPGLSETILGALAASGLAPQRLEVEITESIFLEGSAATLKLLHSLRSLGIRIALDDFGTGYSSLSYLQSFPFDKLKIDRSFIQALLTRPGASAVVRAITDLARALGMETTAEGVEESSQLEELYVHGCSSVQGFLLSRPIGADQVMALFDGPWTETMREARRSA
jgi:diguanylate cyclase (GGDEF)-like protein